MASSTARVDLSLAVVRLRNGAFFRRELFRLDWTGHGQSSLLDCFSERVELDAQSFGDFCSADISTQQLLCFGDDLGRHH